MRTPMHPPRGQRVLIELWGWKCGRCAHEWVPRDMDAEPDGPHVCPKCKSPYWNRPRRAQVESTCGEDDAS